MKSVKKYFKRGNKFVEETSKNSTAGSADLANHPLFRRQQAAAGSEGQAQSQAQAVPPNHPTLPAKASSPPVSTPAVADSPKFIEVASPQQSPLPGNGISAPHVLSPTAGMPNVNVAKGSDQVSPPTSNASSSVPTLPPLAALGGSGAMASLPPMVGSLPSLRTAGGIFSCEFKCGYSSMAMDNVSRHHLFCPLNPNRTYLPNLPEQGTPALAQTGRASFFCGFQCGFAGESMDAVGKHMLTCPLNPAPQSMYSCDFACGFFGTFDEVADHEPHCALNPDPAPPDPPQHSPAEQEEGPVTAAGESGGAGALSGTYVCPFGCGATAGTLEEVTVHMGSCALNPTPQSPVMTASAAEQLERELQEQRRAQQQQLRWDRDDDDHADEHHQTHHQTHQQPLSPRAQLEASQYGGPSDVAGADRKTAGGYGVGGDGVEVYRVPWETGKPDQYNTPAPTETRGHGQDRKLTYTEELLLRQQQRQRAPFHPGPHHASYTPHQGPPQEPDMDAPQLLQQQQQQLQQAYGHPPTATPVIPAQRFSEN